MNIDPNQIAGWVSQLKKHSTTWTNQITPTPLQTHQDLCGVVRSAFVRQALSTGIPVFEHECWYEGESDMDFPSGYSAIYQSNEQAFVANETFAVVISFRYKHIMIIGSKSDVDIWKKHIGES